MIEQVEQLSGYPIQRSGTASRDRHEDRTVEHETTNWSQTVR
jgi:hypothetical protein